VAPKAAFVVVDGRHGTGCELGFWRLDATGVTRIPAPAGAVGPSVSPDGQRIAFTRRDPLQDSSELWVMDSGGGDAHMVFPVGAFGPVRWTADGRILYGGVTSQDAWSIAGDGRVKPDGMTTAQPLRVALGGDAAVLSPDRRRAALQSGNVLVVTRLDGRGWTLASDVVMADGAEPVWARDGRTVLFRTRSGSTILNLDRFTVAGAASEHVLAGVPFGARWADAPGTGSGVRKPARDRSGPVAVLFGDGDATVLGRPGHTLVTRASELFAAVVDPSGVDGGEVTVRRGRKIVRRAVFSDASSLGAQLYGLPVGRYRVTIAATDRAGHRATRTARVKIVD
jgi:WD40-like Beta Propeller Repeat